jgi:hypothetical protein
MHRHNENEKTELRLKAKDAKEARLTEKGEQERAQMEQQTKASFNIHYIEWFYPEKHYGFIVNLKRPLTEPEIESRMLKAFGDL